MEMGRKPLDAPSHYCAVVAPRGSCRAVDARQYGSSCSFIDEPTGSVRVSIARSGAARWSGSCGTAVSSRPPSGGSGPLGAPCRYSLGTARRSAPSRALLARVARRALAGRRVPRRRLRRPVPDRPRQTGLNAPISGAARVPHRRCRRQDSRRSRGAASNRLAMSATMRWRPPGDRGDAMPPPRSAAILIP